MMSVNDLENVLVNSIVKNIGISKSSIIFSRIPIFFKFHGFITIIIFDRRTCPSIDNNFSGLIVRELEKRYHMDLSIFIIRSINNLWTIITSSFLNIVHLKHKKISHTRNHPNKTECPALMPIKICLIRNNISYIILNQCLIQDGLKY